MAACRRRGLGHARRADLSASRLAGLSVRPPFRPRSLRAIGPAAAIRRSLRFHRRQGAGLRSRRFSGGGRRARREAGWNGPVATGDRDAFQLVSDRTTVLFPVRAGQMDRVDPAGVRRAMASSRPGPRLHRVAGRSFGSHSRHQRSRPAGRRAILRRYGTLEGAIAEGRFAAQAEALRLYRSMATMDASAPLPRLPDRAATWATAAKLAAEWGLGQLAERLAALPS